MAISEGNDGSVAMGGEEMTESVALTTFMGIQL